MLVFFQILYEAIWIFIGLPFAFLRLWRKGARESGYRAHWAERVGCHRLPFQTAPIWVHAVSLGEMHAVKPLIAQLQKNYPNVPLLLTTTTPTGRLAAEKITHCHVGYLPYDSWLIMWFWFRRVKPRCVLVMETEIWPSMYLQAATRQIPLYIINARLSPKTFRRYVQLRPVFGPILNSAAKICAQSLPDVNRFQAAGVRQEKVILTGNIKYDMQTPKNLVFQQKELRDVIGNRIVFLVASTHETEEAAILAELPTLYTDCPTALTVLVPRHPNRFERVYQLCLEHQFSVARRSHGETILPSTQIYLGDTTGELLAMISVSTVVFVAGSFAPVGGHNILEPVALKKPTLTGPQTFNFAEVTSALVAGEGVMVVQTPRLLISEVIRLINDPLAAQNLGERGYLVYCRNQGAIARTLAEIKNIVPRES